MLPSPVRAHVTLDDDAYPPKVNRVPQNANAREDPSWNPRIAIVKTLGAPEFWTYRLLTSQVLQSNELLHEGCEGNTRGGSL